VEILQKKSHVSVEDRSVLFIVLQIGAMVGIDFKTHHRPLRFARSAQKS
jgi:phosphate starvation-inducible membrane PsiE